MRFRRRLKKEINRNFHIFPDGIVVGSVIAEPRENCCSRRGILFTLQNVGRRLRAQIGNATGTRKSRFSTD